jgi:hypothetical protein
MTFFVGKGFLQIYGAPLNTMQNLGKLITYIAKGAFTLGVKDSSINSPNTKLVI